MILRVTSVAWDGRSTIATGEGVNEDGQVVTFAGDSRPMSVIAEALELGEEPDAEVPDWGVLSVTDPEVDAQSTGQ